MTIHEKNVIISAIVHRTCVIPAQREDRNMKGGVSHGKEKEEGNEEARDQAPCRTEASEGREASPLNIRPSRNVRAFVFAASMFHRLIHQVPGAVERHTDFKHQSLERRRDRRADEHVPEHPEVPARVIQVIVV